MKIDFGAGDGHSLWISEVADLAQTLEESGLSHLTFTDSQNLCPDIYAMMTIASLGTHRIRIGPAVTNTFTRHPSVTANGMATVNEISGGRAFIGIGLGQSSVGTMGMPARNLQELREVVTFLNKYTAGEEAEFRGARMHSEWSCRRLPVYIAAEGARTCQLAGEMADGVISTGVDPRVVKWKLEQIEKGAQQAQRDPSDVDLWIRTMCYVAESKEEARREVANYTALCATALYFSLSRGENNPQIQKLRKELGTELTEEIKRVHDFYQTSDYHDLSRADDLRRKLVSQKLIDLFILSGTPDDISEAIYKMARAGVKTISISLYTVQDKRGMVREISNTIMPHFRS